MGLVTRYNNNRLGEILDLISCVLTLPFFYSLNYGLGCYYPTVDEIQNKGQAAKLRDQLALGPLLLLLSLCLLPLAISGGVLWLLLCHFLPSCHFSLLTLAGPPTEHQDNFTFATTNVLLAPDILGKWQNLGSVFSRSASIANRLMEQSQDLLHNVPEEERLVSLTRDETVLSRFPHVDVICFQEVFDRCLALTIVSKLRTKYSHFVLDVGKHSLDNNLCMMSAGLMVASRFPLLKVKFVPFTAKHSWQWSLSYGALLCKLDLGQGRVGILANLHNVAYQGKAQLIKEALTQVDEAMAQFRQEVVTQEETLLWEVVGGDFNCDNISPGDQETAHHGIFQSFRDPGMEEPGRDRAWAVGTETRQTTLHTPEMRDPDKFRDILVDNVRRRHYIVDADIEEQTLELMDSKPKPNAAGEVTETVWGGMRRIDKLMYRSSQCCVKGVATVSGLAGLTDHVPIVLAIGSRA